MNCIQIFDRESECVLGTVAWSAPMSEEEAVDAVETSWKEFREWEENDDDDYDQFVDFHNSKRKPQLERVFVENIYVD
jgi:hypothetical protein